MYTLPVEPAQTVCGPEMVATAVGKLVTVVGSVTVDTPHALVAVTETAPELDPNNTWIELVPCPDTIVAPVGTDQI